MSATTTPSLTGPHGSFWVVCEECGGRGFWGNDDDEYGPEDCDRCNGNGGYWDCVDDLCAALIDDWDW